MFTIDNTEGFTNEQIAVLNDALAIVMKNNPGIDESNASDLINNAWIGDTTPEDLAARATQHLG